jgi:pSer/pThr/pTyr-binding forkhead associated (FHA) protein
VALQGGAVIDGREDSAWTLQDGSIIQIGNTTLRYREKSGSGIPTGGINRAL